MSVERELRKIINKQSKFILDLLNDGRIPTEVREGRADNYNALVEDLIHVYDKIEKTTIQYN